MVSNSVAGLTFTFSDLVDVGDLVEISGKNGIVEGIELVYAQGLTRQLQQANSAVQPWKIAVTLEAEKITELPRDKLAWAWKR